VILMLFLTSILVLMAPQSVFAWDESLNAVGLSNSTMSVTKRLLLTARITTVRFLSGDAFV
jgi:hypothetical protein